MNLNYKSEPNQHELDTRPLYNVSTNNSIMTNIMKSTQSDFPMTQPTTTISSYWSLAPSIPHFPQSQTVITTSNAIPNMNTNSELFGESKLSSNSQSKQTNFGPMTEHYVATTMNPILSSTMSIPKYPSFNCPSMPQVNPAATSTVPCYDFRATKQELPNESISQMFHDILALSRAPIPSPDVFTGDPLSYPVWITSFEFMVTNQALSSKEKMLLLRKYVDGQAKDAINNLFLNLNDDSYNQALNILKKRFGEDHHIAQSFREKLNNWSKIRPNNVEELRAFANYLKQCSVMKNQVKGLGLLDDPFMIQMLIEKVPEELYKRWRGIVNNTKKQKNDYPNFDEFVEFIEDEANKIDDAYFGIKKRTSSFCHVSSTEQQNPDRVRKSCLYCKEDHSTSVCMKLQSLTIENRKEWLTNRKLCFACCEDTHMMKGCLNKKKCSLCEYQHPTILHDPTRHTLKKPPTDNGFSYATKDNNSSNNMSSMYVPVYISTKENPENEMLVYAMIDSMSDSTYISEQAADNLDIKGEQSTLRLTTLSCSQELYKCKKYENIRVRAIDSSDVLYLPKTYSHKEISINEAHIPTQSMVNDMPHLRHLKDNFCQKLDIPVGLLIGYNCSEAMRPLEVISGKPNEPYAIKTRIGWSVVGKMSSQESYAQTLFTKTQYENTSDDETVKTEDVTVERLIKVMEGDFSMLEDSPRSQEDTRFLNLLREKTKLNDEGHYEMPLPFKDTEPVLPNNRHIAYKRVMALKKRFIQDPNHFELYKRFMQEILERGEAERVPENELKMPNSWFIPHHGVYNANKPGKIRVVFDCSSKMEGKSLNDNLMQGPDLINSLIGVLIRFRLYQVATTCDVEKMYHQFHVSPSHRNYLRFLWWPDDDLTQQPVDFRMKVHLFGAVSSPGCANYALKQIAKDHENLNPQASRFIQENFYVDDGLNSSESTEEATSIIKGAQDICEKGSLHLHKIASNEKSVLKAFSENDTVNHSEGKRSFERALGLKWSLDTDELQFAATPKDNALTRRGALSIVASVFDPLGLISPIILPGKIILQEMCKLKLDWDEPIPEHLINQWNKWLLELKSLTEIKIPRCYFPSNSYPLHSIELHHFADASTTGYGECSYLRAFTPSGSVVTSLIMAKSRVVPIKKVTIPRLELQAAVLAVKVSQFLDKELQQINPTHVYWTDSKIVLGYIFNETKRFHIFVANRVDQIRQHSEPNQWHYVSSENNPADHASRGLDTEEMINSNWQIGPDFLREETIEFNDPKVDISIDDKEIKAYTAFCKSNKNEHNDEPSKKYSSLAKLIGIYKYATKWYLKWKMKGSQKENPLNDIELQEKTLEHLIKGTQTMYYSCKERQSHRHLKQLHWYQEDGIMRVGGRLENSSESHNIKHPMIVPQESYLAKLIARHYHKKTGHMGRSNTLAMLRQNGIWICGARKVVSSVIHGCIICIRFRGKPCKQQMANLPCDRVEQCPPFQNVGVDCFGPFSIKSGRKEVKRYGLIITCLVSRAVHIEVLEDLSTDAFINALRRFIAIRGTVRIIRCDRGTNFIGAKNEFQQAFKEMDENEIKREMLERSCQFVFNPPAASHFGGVWERLIRSVRDILSGLMAEYGIRLEANMLPTILYEVMAMMNNRPLSVENLEDPTSLSPITPNHLLTLRPNPILPPPGKFLTPDIYSRKRWRRIQYLLEQFWSRWKNEYIKTLQQRKKWCDPSENLKSGDIVIVIDESTYRGDWKLARVEETYPSTDGLVRSVKLKMSHSFLLRPVHKLILLIKSDD